MPVPILHWPADPSALPAALQSGPGCAIVRGFPIDSDEATTRATFTAHAETLGPVLPQTVSGVTLYSVRDEGVVLNRDYGQAGIRTSKTTAAFGFHTDSPSRLAGHTPDLIGLLVLQTAKAGGESIFTDGRQIYATIAAERPDYLERLTKPFWVDRRAELPPGEPPILPIPVFTHEPTFQVRYLRLYIEKGQERARQPLTPAETAALDYLDEVAARHSIRVPLERGDIQWLNNLTHLHGRTAYQDHPEPERKRHYLRIWVGKQSPGQ